MTAVVAGAICVMLAFATGWWPTSILVLLVGALAVITVASAQRFPRFELFLARWMLTPSVILIGLLALVTFPDEYFSGGCREYSTPVWREAERPPDDCRVVRREHRENRSDRVNHGQGVAMLGLSSAAVAFVLATRRARGVSNSADSGTGVALLLLNCLFLLGASVVLHPDFWVH